MNHEMNFKRGIFFWKLEVILAVVWFCAWVILPLLTFVVHLHAHQGWHFFGIGAIAIMLFCVCLEYNKDEEILLTVWVNDLGQMLRHFPFTLAERKGIADWAQKRLQSEAKNATIAFGLRDIMKTNLDCTESKPIFILQVTPEKLAEVRTEEKARKKAIARMRKAYKRLSEDADRQSKKYLRIWDFFTKEDPEGLAILAGLDDPEEFRKRLSRAA